MEDVPGLDDCLEKYWLNVNELKLLPSLGEMLLNLGQVFPLALLIVFVLGAVLLQFISHGFFALNK